MTGVKCDIVPTVTAREPSNVSRPQDHAPDVSVEHTTTGVTASATTQTVSIRCHSAPIVASRSTAAVSQRLPFQGAHNPKDGLHCTQAVLHNTRITVHSLVTAQTHISGVSVKVWR